MEEVRSTSGEFVYIATRVALIFSGLAMLCIVDFLANG
jgi:hypothetical protein